LRTGTGLSLTRWQQGAVEDCDGWQIGKGEEKRTAHIATAEKRADCGTD
jgi:hypothetical protein